MNLLVIFNKDDAIREAYTMETMGTTKRAIDIARSILKVLADFKDIDVVTEIFRGFPKETDPEEISVMRVEYPSIEIDLDSNLADISDAFHVWIDSEYEGSLDGIEEIITSTLRGMNINDLLAVEYQLSKEDTFTDDCYVLSEIK